MNALKKAYRDYLKKEEETVLPFPPASEEFKVGALALMQYILPFETLFKEPGFLTALMKQFFNGELK